MENVFSRESFAKTRAQTEDVIAGWRPKVMGAVIEAFVKLHEKGLIYQGSYMVNWSPNLQTAVSDLEVYSEEPGFLYHIKYRVAGSPDFLTIATTRPETLFGDVAIAVHPEKMPTIQLWRENQKQAEVTGGHKAHFVVNEVREMIENDSIS